MTPWLQDADVTLYHGDVLQVLAELPDGSVDCVVCSPPYWGLRSYLDDAHDDKPLELGLEPTPDQYVQRIVHVFHEVRRVLAAHGTCWVNLGDSYAGGGGYSPGSPSNVARQDALAAGDDRDGAFVVRGEHNYLARQRDQRGVPGGLKPKDLVGIPWKVVQALQAPYYTGRIKDERDRIWLAAMVDAEGCIHIHRRKAGEKTYSKFDKADGTTSEYVRKQDTYGVMVSIDNTSEAIIDRCHAIVGQGSRYKDEAGTGVQQRRQTLHRLTLTGQQSRELLRELYPHLVAKQHEARIAIASPSNGDEAARAHAAIKDLHNGRETGLDYPPPEGMWERGWFLRSEIIWAKCMPNPMPESVTDRPTKSHETVFLLTKQPRYWFDQEAVREPHNPDGRKVTAHPGPGDYSIQERSNGDRWPNAGRNVRSVWTVATQPYPEAHFATYPEELVRRCVLAGCPVRVCRVCGKPSERLTDVTYELNSRTGGVNTTPRGGTAKDGPVIGEWRMTQKQDKIVETLGWSDCDCLNAWHGCHHCDGVGCEICENEGGWHEPKWRPGTVLDPFVGSGTTCKVARDHGRHSIGIDLSADYLALAARRLQQQSLFSEVT